MEKNELKCLEIEIIRFPEFICGTPREHLLWQIVYWCDKHYSTEHYSTKKKPHECMQMQDVKYHPQFYR